MKNLNYNLKNTAVLDDNLELWENLFWKNYGWIPRLDTQRGIDELLQFKSETITVLPPQYDAEPPMRPVFKFIHGPVTTGRGSQLCYTEVYTGD